MQIASAIKVIGAWPMLRAPPPDLAAIQLSKLCRQLPLLYFILIINMTAVAFTHHGLAPLALTAGVPAVLGSICALRAVHWARRAGTTFSTEEAIAHLRRILILAVALSVLFVAWGLTLDRYGGPYEHGHIAFFTSITVIGVIFCLVHHPQAASAVTICVMIPYLGYYLIVAHPVFIAIAVNLLLVLVVMARVLSNTYRAFVDLERSQTALASEQAQSRALSTENARLANTDSLTGLPNRRAFFGKLDELIATAEDTGAGFALGVLDLDGFKPINDSLGHAVGDRVLIEISRRLSTLKPADVVVARLGGDEFGLLLPGRTAIEVLEQFGRDVCERLSATLTIDDMHLGLGASCGLATHMAATSAASLYDRADYALYDAKVNQRGGAVIFAERHEKRLRAERAVEAALVAADLEAEMEVHFQAIVDLTTRLDVSAEALARWNSPVLGRVPPDRFIEVAERTGLIRALTPVLLGKALASAATWPDELGLSFNLSAHDMVSTETVLALVTRIGDSGVDPARITFEITETAVMRDFDLARSHISLLRSIGVKIALDDFGAGYSSLSCVHRLPLDKIKIDRSFVKDITQRMEARKVVQTILDLCQTLGLDCIVEGVETAEQCSLIAELGGRYIQGYYLARPLPEAEFMERQSRATAIAA